MYEKFPFEGYYAFICTDAPDSIPKREASRPLHLARLLTLKKENRLLLAGPFLDPNDHSKPIGGLIIAKFDSYEDAKHWMEDEPYLKSGAYTQMQLKTYKDVLAFIEP